ncbi:hypothetical protein COB57_02900 [Candidatus Peregrinibacteria bacterium]|nr:MAG: hypothetical protein COB57_02900 [Candidatus Peregrinibacteria bacterium]
MEKEILNKEVLDHFFEDEGNAQLLAELIRMNNIPDDGSFSELKKLMAGASILNDIEDAYKRVNNIPADWIDSRKFPKKEYSEDVKRILQEAKEKLEEDIKNGFTADDMKKQLIETIYNTSDSSEDTDR